MSRNIIGLCVINRARQLLGHHDVERMQGGGGMRACQEWRWFSLLDVIIEKEHNGDKYPDAYLGLISTTDDCMYHAYVTNTGVKFILAVKESGGQEAVKESALREKLKELVEWYSDLLLDPFYKEGSRIPLQVLSEWMAGVKRV